MSSPVLFHTADDAERHRALDPSRSFTVQAPAGSGKTELLIQRFLGLLAVVQRPETIVAITFTRKAAGEMMERIVKALRDADGHPADDDIAEEAPHRRLTRDLARRALARDRELGWNLLQHPGRLRVQTIDSLCMSIVAEMPWLARLGGTPRIEEDASPLYEEAAHLTLSDESTEFQDALTTLLRHLDNNTVQARNLIATMLARRDQWLRLLPLHASEERTVLEESLARTVEENLAKADRFVPNDLRRDWLASAQFAAAHGGGPAPASWPEAAAEQTGAWQALCNLVLTIGNDWRKQLNRNCGFPTDYPVEKAAGLALIEQLRQHRGLLEELKAIRKLPPAHFTDSQWEALRAVLQCLRLAVGQLRVLFREQRTIDFIELGAAALDALGGVDDPTDLAFQLDSRIEHLLLDEFQDTSRWQFELIEKLTAEWQDGDGRTLFIVGDPMQSIYRFRQAEVGLFLEVRGRGIGHLHPGRVDLTLNRRSLPALVERVNELLAARFPRHDDPETGAVQYSESLAAKEGTTEDGRGEVTFDGFRSDEDGREAACVVRRIKESRARDPRGSIAVLVRARTHLFAITEAVKQAGIPFEAVEIDPLGERTAVRDLLALTRALLNPADRVAWLAILRAPWCGLELGDLEALVRDRRKATVEECLGDLGALSEDGRPRAARIREIMAEAAAERGRWPLRRWIERTWVRLGGPAVLECDPHTLEEAAAYLERLEAEPSGCDVPDFDRLQQWVTKLYAKAQKGAAHEVQIMTIHKAKGLEFDTVIMPGLGRQAKTDDAPLILSHEWRNENRFECLLAPIDETGAERTPLYEYLQFKERQKNDWERVRQLYVAVTRAKKRLHLMGQVQTDRKGAPRPRSQTMLADLWPKLSPEEQTSFLSGSAQNTGTEGTSETKWLRRLPASWHLPDLPGPVMWEGSDKPLKELHEPSFEWVGETLRHIGTVVHAFLQRMAGQTAALADIPDLAYIRKAVAHAGVVSSEIETAAARVHRAIGRAASDSRCQWILGSHEDARSEYAITGFIDGEIVRGQVDRTFVENGVRWIIDFKTSTHEGGNLSLFLDEQERRYRDQMERYARILAPLGYPVRVGLYFPLLNEWREWTPAIV